MSSVRNWQHGKQTATTPVQTSAGTLQQAMPERNLYPCIPSRFCPTCGNKYSMERTTSMSFKLVNTTHRHCVFTIDENLRDFFLNDRSLLDCLFHAVNNVVSRTFFKQNKSMNFTPGFIMVLHTFGRDLKWNPHIHCLISKGGYSDNGFWRNIHYFNYTFLRNAFRTALLNEMEARIGHSFKMVKAQCYRERREGSTCMQNPTAVTPKQLLNTLGAILASLPSLPQVLINTMVTLLLSTISAMKMSSMWKRPSLLWNLLNDLSGTSQKSMIRYGGIYARHRKIDKKLNRAVSREKHHINRSFNQWRTAILSAFGYDPLKCECGANALFRALL